ncbi:MAG: ribbon-helix-helix protein, CopG family [Bacilli bacterium]
MNSEEKFTTKTIHFLTADKEFIDEEASRLGMSSSQLIRNIVTEYIKKIKKERK